MKRAGHSPVPADFKPKQNRIRDSRHRPQTMNGIRKIDCRIMCAKDERGPTGGVTLEAESDIVLRTFEITICKANQATMRNVTGSFG